MLQKIKHVKISAVFTFLAGTSIGAFLSGLRECLSCKNCIKGVTLGLDDVSAAHKQLCDMRDTLCAERFCQNYSLMHIQHYSVMTHIQLEVLFLPQEQHRCLHAVPVRVFFACSLSSS